eukprot:5817345-Prymnesium_polylepis.3
MARAPQLAVHLTLARGSQKVVSAQLLRTILLRHKAHVEVERVVGPCSGHVVEPGELYHCLLQGGDHVHQQVVVRRIGRALL